MGHRFLLPLLLSAFVAVHPQTNAPAGPGADANWETAGKQAIGTANSLTSKVWFTLAAGVMTEVYYPDVTTPNVRLLQFIVVNPRTKNVETERDDAIHEIKPLRRDSLTFQQINTARSRLWKITKTYITDPQSDTVLIDVTFVANDPGLRLYVYFDPSIANSGMHDTATQDGKSFVAFDRDIAAALAFSTKIENASVGFYRTSDGIAELHSRGTLASTANKAVDGNVTGIARIVDPRHFAAALSFAKKAGPASTPVESQAELNSQLAAKLSFPVVRAAYEKGWVKYVDTLPRVDPEFQSQFNIAAMVLKAHEDKTHPGGNVASLTNPWGGGINADEVTTGYHLVWARDLYQVATAYIALGDTAAANRALDFVFNTQQRPDGSVPQISFLDGKAVGDSLQMDEVAYPLVLAYQLGRSDKGTYEHVKRSADLIARKGPYTQQERWEEKSGYSPSTIAAEIAGLVCAADLGIKNGDAASAARWLATADNWARHVDPWTATTTGKYGDGNYYIRISEKGEPDGGHNIDLGHTGKFRENEIVDAGFLELVRLGIKPADDPLIIKSIKVVDDILKVDTPNGPAFYRYNHDGYGEMEDGRRWNWDGKYTGLGHLWTLLSGERGEYEIALQGRQISMGVGRTGTVTCTRPDNYLTQARCRLQNMAAFANAGLMIPEQIWDRPGSPSNIDRQFVPELKFGEGTGSATPLAWSMAQFIRLATNLKAGRNLETPQVVYDRYKNGIPPKTD